MSSKRGISLGTLVLSIIILMFFTGPTLLACVFPGDDKLITETNKISCFKEALFILPQPPLSISELIQSLDGGFYSGDESRKDFSRGDSVTCLYRPHYAFKAKAGFDVGNSPKIRCADLIKDANGKFNTLIHEKFPTENKTWLMSDISIDNSGKFITRSDGKKIKMDEFKVKFAEKMPPNHNKRHNEVATEVFVTRLFWALGVPADYMFAVKDVTALGANNDWRGLRKWIENSSGPVPFKYGFAAIERDPPGKTIETDKKNEEDFWKLSWAKQNITTTAWNDEQKLQFDMARLAWSLVNFFNLDSGSLSKQTRLTCGQYTKTPENNIQCTQVIAYVQDVGSSMGGKKGFFLGQNPRGDLSKYAGHKVFKNLTTCEVQIPFENHNPKVRKDAVLRLNERLEKIAPLNDQTFIKNLVEYSRLHIVDPGSTVDGWVSAFYERRKEIDSQAQLIKQNQSQCL
ncbi:hypothetical protein L0244_39590 [bacterium]|nr:hypothetical protein [bacterium]